MLFHVLDAKFVQQICQSATLLELRPIMPEQDDMEALVILEK